MIVKLFTYHDFCLHLALSLVKQYTLTTIFSTENAYLVSCRHSSLLFNTLRSKSKQSESRRKKNVTKIDDVVSVEGSLTLILNKTERRKDLDTKKHLCRENNVSYAFLFLKALR